MNWDAIGAIAELLGAIGVIASLVYLATQIRQSRNQMVENTRALQAGTYQDLQRKIDDAFNRLIVDPENRRSIRLGMSDQGQLGEDDAFVWRSRGKSPLLTTAVPEPHARTRTRCGRLHAPIGPLALHPVCGTRAPMLLPPAPSLGGFALADQAVYEATEVVPVHVSPFAPPLPHSRLLEETGHRPLSAFPYCGSDDPIGGELMFLVPLVEVHSHHRIESSPV